MPLQQTALDFCARPIHNVTPWEAEPYTSLLSPVNLYRGTDEVGATKAKPSLSVYSGGTVHFETTRINASFLCLLFWTTSRTAQASKRVDGYGLARDLKWQSRRVIWIKKKKKRKKSSSNFWILFWTILSPTGFTVDIKFVSSDAWKGLQCGGDFVCVCVCGTVK